MFSTGGLVMNSLPRLPSRIFPVSKHFGSRNRGNRNCLTHRITVQPLTFQRIRFLCSSSKDDNDILETDEFESPSPYQNIDFAALTGDDPNKIRALKTAQLEADMYRLQGRQVPSSISTKEWSHVLELDSTIKRAQYYKFLWANERKSLLRKTKRAEARQKFVETRAKEPVEQVEVTTSGPIIYSLSYNTLFHRIRLQTLKSLGNIKLLYASMFSPHIVVDCSYEAFMDKRNLNHLTKQILLMWSENRMHPNPFHLVFCNLHADSEQFSLLHYKLPFDSEPDFPFHYTPKHYLDLYPKEKLVYLSPHCSTELDRFNGDDIYIIGGFVDRRRSEPLSLAKAKKEGLRVAKFPLDRYLNWKLGIKSLTLNQCLAIMNDLKDSNDWNHALKNVPSRKVRFTPKNDEEYEAYSNRMSAKRLKSHYQKNIVYDLLLLETQKQKKVSSEETNS